MDGFINYYRTTWIEKVTPNDYSVYLEEKRTNNDLERNNRTWHEIAGNRPRLIVFLDSIVNMMQKVHMDYNERREVGIVRRRPSSEEEVRAKFLLRGWATIHGLNDSVSVRHRQQVLMEFLETSVNITNDFHMRVEYLATGEEP
ncbi:uncharacterized protein LOC117174619 isoform X2 [Belonocnema kinseyi]|uniref:uncharacterized protein LOC117174619 isoform X2 n=1 Tax=Belonocnema kinseyi TaxID=2817044 RepID=UPI00143DF6A2|nr:uncharacterized protein LOC117174619 isoform X2 [Belonocnema kinseyi]